MRIAPVSHMEVTLNYCSQSGGNVYRAPYYNGNPNIGPRIIGNLDQYPYTNPRYPQCCVVVMLAMFRNLDTLGYFEERNRGALKP